jgi:prephenate dehydrogenase
MNISHIGFIGFGLIGGSIAKSLKQSHPDLKVTVTSRTLAPIYEAQNDGVVDFVAKETDSSFSDCDIIFICTPVVTITQYLAQLKSVIKPGCIVTDVGSVKSSIHKAVTSLDMEDVFIGGHPMAGSEMSGYKYSDATLLVSAKYVITPTKKTTKEQLDTYIELVHELKAVPIVMDCETHDYSAAAISHVPHLISAALAKMVCDCDGKEQYMHLLAAGGFKDTTRIAASSPEMWQQICDSNADAISQLLGEYIKRLEEVRTDVDNHDTDAIAELFKEAGRYRSTFPGNKV